MTELRHLQLVILQITKDIDALCQKNNIEYHLIAGSAIGAIRHKGFIPWDDDLDIEMTNENYQKFIRVCREQLDKEKYYFQEGLVDWPLNYSKIKLRGTRMEEPEGYAGGDDQQGIFIDIFKLDHAPKEGLTRRWQYFCSKVRMSYLLSQRTYRSASLKKRIYMALSFPQKWHPVREFFNRQVERYNDRPAEYYANFFGKTRYNTCFLRKDMVETSVRVPFEDTELPVPVKYDEYLRHLFGDYMQLPPESQRVQQHLISVDFGKY